MLARLIATVAALLLACASPQAQAHVRDERVSVSFADLARAAAQETAPPAKTTTEPKTALPARANAENPAPRKNAALSHCRVGENWSPLQECASMPGVYQWDGTRLAGRTNATGTSLGDYQHAYGWAISSREGAVRSTLHTDVHGTPQLITDGTGAIAGWTRTDVWGVEKASTGAQSRLGHTGYLKDPLLGDELYAQARQYRAGVGRFTSRDEWEGDFNNPVSLNPYLYGGGNPGTFTDPDGRCYGPAIILCPEILASIGIAGSGAAVVNKPVTADQIGRFDLGKYALKGISLNGSSSPESMVANPVGPTIYETPADPPGSGWNDLLHEYPPLPPEVVSGVMPGRTAEVVENRPYIRPMQEEIGGDKYEFPSDGRMDSNLMMAEAPNDPATPTPTSTTTPTATATNAIKIPPLLLTGPSQGQQNAIRGNEFERQVIRALYAEKNATSFTSINGQVTTIPDLSLNSRYGVTDIKDEIKLSFDRQLRAQYAAAETRGDPFNLIISPRTQSISVPLQDAIRNSGGHIFEYNPTTEKFGNVTTLRNRVIRDPTPE